MTNIRDINAVRGTVFNLPHAMSLSDDDCNVLLVSSRTLFFIQMFGSGEIDFTARYASSFLEGNRYVLAETATELSEINDIGNRYELEVQPVTCDIVGALNGIQQAILAVGSNACACGVVGETIEAGSGVPGGDPPEGFGLPDGAIANRTCKAANAIHQSIVNAITALDDSPVEGFLALGFGIVAGLVSAIIAAAFLPVVGILVIGVAGVVVSVTLALLASGIDLASLKTELIASTEDLICVLTGAVSATAARDAYVGHLTSQGQSSANTALIGVLLTNNVLDLLWFSTPDSEAFLSTYVPVYDCSGCDETFTHIFDFTVDDGGWVNGAAYSRDFGIYVPGVGWEGQWGTIGVEGDERLYMTRIFASRDITSIECKYTMSGPNGPVSQTIITTMVTVDTVEPWPCTDCNFNQLYQPSPADSTGELRTVVVADTAAEFLVDILCYEIVVSGKGADPF